MCSWFTIAAVSDSQAGQNAATAATVDVFVDSASTTPDTTITGLLSLERFGSMNLFRVVVHNAYTARNIGVLCLPPDCMWHAARPRKIKGRRSGLKAIEINVMLPTGHKEGYDRLCITAPYDGETGSAMLFASALVWASQEVMGAIT
jgi:hypothetical protein